MRAERNAGAGMDGRLRVGLLLPDLRAAAWVARAVEELRADGGLELACVALEPHADAARSLLERIYRRLDDRLFGQTGDALEPRDLGPLLEGVPRVPVERLPGLGLDALVQLATGAPSRAAREGARYGVFGCYLGGDPSDGVAEVLCAAPTTESGVLQWLPREETPRVWIRSIAATDPISPRRSLSPILSKTAAFPARVLRALARGERPTPELEPPGETRAGSAVTLHSSLALVARIVRRRLRHLLFRQEWQIGWRSGGDELRADGVHYAEPDAGRFWADPFLLARAGRVYVFFEDASFATGIGRICWGELGAAGQLAHSGVALERDWHLSYPFVIEHGGELYMLPECGATRSLELYRCVEFPSRWEPCATLLKDVAAYDATLHHDGEHWWIFAIVEPPGGSSCDELCLFFADDLQGPWRPHPHNPVKSDARGSRPAGRLFRRDGAWIRPSQDCTREYGRALRFQRILRLDPEHYEEEEIAAIEPAQRRQIGIHTVNRARDVLVFDRRMLVPRLPWLGRFLR